MVATIFSQGRFNMRKVLLATTALVALGGVSAASADISISGTGTFDIVSNGSGNTDYSSDGNIVIKGSSTTDSGLTLTAVQDMKFEGGATDNVTTNVNHVADSYIDIAGDFGSIRMGNTDDALDRMDGALPSNYDLEGVGLASTPETGAALGGDSVNISYISPSVSGVTVYASTTEDAGIVGYGVNYSAGPVTLMLQAEDDGTNDQTAIGAQFKSGAIMVGVGSKRSKAGSTNTNSTEVGGSYTMGDATIIATSQKRGSNKYNNIGLKYSVAPGLTVSAESGTLNSATSTWFSIAVAF
jgi:hypothetical protein